MGKGDARFESSGRSDLSSAIFSSDGSYGYDSYYDYSYDELEEASGQMAGFGVGFIILAVVGVIIAMVVLAPPGVDSASFNADGVKDAFEFAYKGQAEDIAGKSVEEARNLRAPPRSNLYSGYGSPFSSAYRNQYNRPVQQFPDVTVTRNDQGECKTNCDSNDPKDPGSDNLLSAMATPSAGHRIMAMVEPNQVSAFEVSDYPSWDHRTRLRPRTGENFAAVTADTTLNSLWITSQDLENANGPTSAVYYVRNVAVPADPIVPDDSEEAEEEGVALRQGEEFRMPLGDRDPTATTIAAAGSPGLFLASAAGDSVEIVGHPFSSRFDEAEDPPSVEDCVAGAIVGASASRKIVEMAVGGFDDEDMHECLYVLMLDSTDDEYYLSGVIYKKEEWNGLCNTAESALLSKLPPLKIDLTKLPDGEQRHVHISAWPSAKTSAVMVLRVNDKAEGEDLPKNGVYRYEMQLSGNFAFAETTQWKSPIQVARIPNWLKEHTHFSCDPWDDRPGWIAVGNLMLGEALEGQDAQGNTVENAPYLHGSTIDIYIDDKEAERFNLRVRRGELSERQTSQAQLPVRVGSQYGNNIKGFFVAKPIAFPSQEIALTAAGVFFLAGTGALYEDRRRRTRIAAKRKEAIANGAKMRNGKLAQRQRSKRHSLKSTHSSKSMRSTKSSKSVRSNKSNKSTRSGKSAGRKVKTSMKRDDAHVGSGKHASGAANPLENRLSGKSGKSSKSAKSSRSKGSGSARSQASASNGSKHRRPSTERRRGSSAASKGKTSNGGKHHRKHGRARSQGSIGSAGSSIGARAAMEQGERRRRKRASSKSLVPADPAA